MRGRGLLRVGRGWGLLRIGRRVLGVSIILSSRVGSWLHILRGRPVANREVFGPWGVARLYFVYLTQ